MTADTMWSVSFLRAILSVIRRPGRFANKAGILARAGRQRQSAQASLAATQTGISQFRDTQLTRLPRSGVGVSPEARRAKGGGAKRDRTADLLHAMQALSQLSYGPI